MMGINNGMTETSFGSLGGATNLNRHLLVDPIQNHVCDLEVHKMSVSNPSHLLISRNPPRSLAHPQLAPTSTSRHAARSITSPAGILGPWTQSTEGSSTTRSPNSLHNVVEDPVEHDQSEIQDEEVEIHETFSRDASLPGRVKVVVGRHEFWCHKDILWFASPFFQGLLQGR